MMDLGQNRHGSVGVSPDQPGETIAERNDMLELAAQIVSAHISNNAVAPDELSPLIQQVFNTLATVERATTASPKPAPAVPVQRSVFKDHIVCLDCGKHFSMIKRHLMTDHKLTVQQYRQRWELPSSYPLVSPDYAKTRSALAKKIGLGRHSESPRQAGRMAAKKAAKR